MYQLLLIHQLGVVLLTLLQSEQILQVIYHCYLIKFNVVLLNTVPEVPQNLMYRNLTSTSVEISWEPPSTFNGPNEGYNVTYNRIETNERKTVNVLSTSLNITALEIYEEYSVEVVALSDKGAGEATEILVLTDEDCKCGRIIEYILYYHFFVSTWNN